MENKAVPPEKVKNCRRCGGSIIKVKVKKKSFNVTVYHEYGLYIVILKEGRYTEHVCG